MHVSMTHCVVENVTGQGVSRNVQRITETLRVQHSIASQVICQLLDKQIVKTA